jgi:hypothetical protein
VADAGFEGYKSIISVEFMLKIAVAVNATAEMINTCFTDPLESVAYPETGESGEWLCAILPLVHTTL